MQERPGIDESSTAGVTRAPDVAHAPDVAVFQGSPLECTEFGLVLDAKGVAYERLVVDGAATLKVAADAAEQARDELARYAAERRPRPVAPHALEIFAGSSIGAGLYAAVLMIVAYCAGRQLFEVDWLTAGALDAAAVGRVEWWRAFTALTLHVDQEHLLGNLLFGIGIGVLAGRLFGPGLAWAAILLAGACANYLEMLLAPPGHHAVGASTAVFAALGLLTGFAWSRELSLRDRRLYRFGPLFAGVSLLALLGSGNAHVDVLGHLLGFVCGTTLGRILARTGLPPRQAWGWQVIPGGMALALLASAWREALVH